MSCTGSTISPWTRVSALPSFWVRVLMSITPFDFSQIRIADREARGMKNCASTFTTSNIRPVGGSRRRCARQGKCSGACAEVSSQICARGKTNIDCCLDLADLASFGSAYRHCETDLVRGGDPGHTFVVVNRC